MSADAVSPDPIAVLLVEDDDDVRGLLAEHLHRLGCTVIPVATGEEVWAAAQQDRPDVVIVDLFLPGMSGAEVIDRLRSDPALAECRIVVTSVLEPSEYPRAHAALPKPFTRRQVAKALADALRDRP